MGNSRIRIVDTGTDREINTLGQPDDSANPSFMTFSPDGRVLASTYTDSAQQIMGSNSRLSPAVSGTGTNRTITRSDPAQLNRALQNLHSPMVNKIELWDVASGRELKALAEESAVQSIAFSPDGRLVASASYRQIAPAAQRVNFGPVVSSGNKKGRVPVFGRLPAPASAPPAGTGSGSGAAADEVITLWDIATGKQTRSIDCGGQDARVIAISPDGHLLAATGQTIDSNTRDIADVLKHGVRANLQVTTRVWNLDTGQALISLAPITHLSSMWGSLLAFSPDSRILAASGNDNTIDLWNASGDKLRTLRGGSSAPDSIAFSSDGRLLATSSLDGTVLWDVETGKRLATLVSIHDGADWMVVTPDGLFDGTPAAWNQILWRYNNDTFAVAPVESFFNEFYYPGLLADIIAGKRPQAALDISTKDRRQPQVKLAVASGQASGDGSVAVRSVKVRIDIAAAEAGARDLRLFRNGSLVRVWHGDVLKGQPSGTLDAAVPIVAGENRLTAYAFNHDNVKSVDAALSVRGADSLKRAGTLYVLIVGVNAYANREYDLKYAVSDARAFGDEVKRQQSTQASYSSTEVISLLDSEATKSNIMLALNRFAGIEAAALPRDAPKSLLSIKPVEPEDAVVVYYAGHGTAQQSRFYLIPHDLGYTGHRTDLNAQSLQTILDHGISDQELEQAFEAIDAGRLLLVIDACNSGQALDAEEKRRGPMNSKGLAQLAYEKGMYILTAAQSYQAALEAAQLGHGYLTYALVEEGLKTPAADVAPKDGQVTIREWLDYATQRVPQMQQAKMRDSRDLVHKTAFVEGEEKVDDVEKRSVQRPRAFYRRELEAQPMVVAKLPHEK
jgi:WD40 repeat protein